MSIRRRAGVRSADTQRQIGAELSDTHINSQAAETDGADGRALRHGACLIGLFNGLLGACLYLKPFAPATLKLLDNLMGGLGPAAMLGWVVLAALRERSLPRQPMPAGRRRALCLLWLGLASYCLGQGIFAYMQAVLPHVPFPSWYDLFYLGMYPLLLLGILSLPTRSLPPAARTRVFLDGLVTMTAMVTFSWYFLFGPIILGGGETPLGKLVSAAYPFMDLLLIFCLLALLTRAESVEMRRAALILSAGLGCIVATDTIYGYEMLHQTYVNGSLFEIGWPLGQMLVGLGIRAVQTNRKPSRAEAEDPTKEAAGRTEPVSSLSRLMLPYALVPAMSLLVIYTAQKRGDEQLEPGVYLGSLLLVGILLLRQMLALMENHKLYHSLQGAYLDLESRNRRIEEYALNQQSLNTARKKAEEIIRWQAYHDALTGLANRELFHDRLRQALAAAERHRTGMAVLFLDLDRFKNINDTLGHAAGDRLLREVAQRLAACVRAEDTVARMGGDEFTLLLPDVCTPEDGAKVAQKLLASLAEPICLEGHELFVTTSLGLSFYPADGQDAQTLLKHADVAMYRAKEQGRNGFQLYTEAMNAAALEHLILENSLRKAIERKEFLLFYQPQIELKTGRLLGVEALLRWEHPELGLILPTRFIPLAEEMGLIVPLGEWALREACRQAVAWQAEGHYLRVAVNLSARQLRQRDLAQRTASILAETGLEAHWIDLELTESALVENGEEAVQILQEMKQLGVQLAIDDFGTGYSSLAYLRKFPLDILKVDRSFVQSLAEDSKDQAVVQALIAMAHALGLAVIAEGVETPAQQECLRAMGCDAVQGFLFSPALPIEKLETWFPEAYTAELAA